MSTSDDIGLHSNENPPLPVNRNKKICHYFYTQDQSLALLAKALDIPTDRLPSEAKQIHNQCKGMPLLISKFATEFETLKEQLINSEERWQHYQKKRLIEKIAKFLDTSIKELDPDLQNKFYKLAIFDTDVNIPSKTLGHLWGLNHLEVDEKMIVFCQKGLAVRKWQEKLKTYVYIINETVLSHLKFKLRPKKLKKLHRLLIQKYREVCKNDFAKLPDDNYSYTYIGHHLEQAQLYELFEVYLNLEFIQAKIVNAGLSDLLKDIQIYEKHIIRNSREIKLDNLISFLKDQRKIITQHQIRNCLDVVQVVFYQTKDVFWMHQARKLAKKRSTSLYISAIKNVENDGVTSTSTESTIASFNKDISAICITKETNSLLVATADGGIHLKNVDTLKSQYFSGFHEKIITKLILAHEAKCFLALSDEGKAKLFFLNGQEMSDNGNNNLNPREKQKFWTGFFRNEDDSCQTFVIENDLLADISFSPDDKFIVGCTPKGTIQVWNKSGDKLQTIKMSNNCFSKMTFTTDLYQNLLLHVMDEKLCLLVVYQYGNNKFEYKTLYNPSTLKEGEKMKIIFLGGLPNEKNSLIFVSQNKAVHVRWLQEAKHHQILNFIKRTITGINEPDAVFVGAALTHDGQNLIIAKSDGWINVWRVYASFEPVAFFKGTVTSLDTHWIKDQGHHRFFGSQNGLIYKWELNKIQDSKPLIKPLFNAIMKPLGEDDIVVKRTAQHKIDIFRGKRDFWKKMSEVVLAEGLVTTMILSEDGKNLIYDHINAKKRQEIFHFDIQRRISNRIDTLETVSNFIKIVTNLETGVALIYQNNSNNLSGAKSILRSKRYWRCAFNLRDG
ncbi:apoptotic protease-activating factor 1-like [Belonocnema kinseyi]|uniref:apoptotic protease-activating factor 1-like n=1 Tax=Belonocnema kinseyi TaxID=2817044 RepID=UPI00143D0C11|nr:apoptotic protease-activating factor 1-like [Belonocnema kinseyi]